MACVIGGFWLRCLSDQHADDWYQSIEALTVAGEVMILATNLTC